MPGEAPETMSAKPEPASAEESEKQQKNKGSKPRKVAQRVRQTVANDIVIKRGNVSFLANRDGMLPVGRLHGGGLYYHDCRYLRGYEVKLDGKNLQSLVADATEGYTARLQLTNQAIRSVDGGALKEHSIGIKWERAIDQGKLALIDRITITNYSMKPADFVLEFTFDACFEPVFVIRGMQSAKTGTRRPPRWEDGTLNFLYEGVDHVYRATAVHFSEKPHKTGPQSARFKFKIPPKGVKELGVRVVIAESKEEREVQPAHFDAPPFEEVLSQCKASTADWTRAHARVSSDAKFVERSVGRCLADLRMLRSALGGDHYFDAGLPWYACLFGRDSLVAAIETLAFASDIAEQNVRLLARYQADTVDEWRDAEPGKILHELRVGELANSDQIPQTPYYGSIDSTMWFLITIGLHAAWAGTLTLFKDMLPHIERALKWIDEYADHNGDGYVDYESKSSKGLANQGWKDSGDAIMNADGSLAKPPVALVEVQGYVYMAKKLMAGLFRRKADNSRGAELDKQADELKERFNRDFWLVDKSCYALALQQGGAPCAVIASNPGQALWTGIIDDPTRIRATVAHLMSEDMFNGWGIRTLSSRELRYNPVGYHLGTVWPHDNAIIASAFRQCGHDEEFEKIFHGILEVASYMSHERLPELISGYPHDDYHEPVRYPVACHPQAWAAGSLPMMLTQSLGLKPNAFEKDLLIDRPMLPRNADRLELHGLRVGQATATLRFEREGPNIKVRAQDVYGELQIRVRREGEPEQRAA